MFELNEHNAVDYLRRAGRAGDGQVMVQSLSGGVANVVLRVFDADAGEKIGTDLRSAAKIKAGAPDTRMSAGRCMVLKQPLEKFKTAQEWLVERDRVWVERDCMTLLHGILPAGSAPEVIFSDEENYILAISCAPVGAVIWKSLLLDGAVDKAAAENAGVLLAMMHSATRGDKAVAARYGETKFFIQQRTDPYFRTLAERHADLQKPIDALIAEMLEARQCLIHGDYSPKNMFAIYDRDDLSKKPPVFRHMMLLDFEVAFYGHCAFDVATLVNHLLLKGFHRGPSWRPYMLAADAFWNAYRAAGDPTLVAAAQEVGGRVLGALLMARVDGKSPAEYITDETVKERIRACGKRLLSADVSLEEAFDQVADFMA